MATLLIIKQIGDFFKKTTATVGRADHIYGQVIGLIKNEFSQKALKSGAWGFFSTFSYIIVWIQKQKLCGGNWWHFLY